MKVITKSSEYELTKDSKGYRIEKTAIKPGCQSRVSVGMFYEDVRIFLAGSHKDQLLLGNLGTSPVENVDEVRKWLDAN